MSRSTILACHFSHLTKTISFWNYNSCTLIDLVIFVFTIQSINRHLIFGVELTVWYEYFWEYEILNLNRIELDDMWYSELINAPIKYALLQWPKGNINYYSYIFDAQIRLTICRINALELFTGPLCHTLCFMRSVHES